MIAALVAPLAVLVLAALVPLLSARLLARIFLRDAPRAGEARARRLVPLRAAASLVGIAQLAVAWIAGVRVIVPPLARPDGGAAVAFGLVAVAITFVAGGVARRVEDPPDDRATARGAALLRLRLLPWFLGPGLAGQLAASLPVVQEGASGPTIRWGWVALSLLVATFGVAYGGLIALLATRSLLPATPAVRALARDAAARERTPLALVLRLPTPGARFANAAAIPWARTMIVTDAITSLLTPDELRAVLAHEAGHLSEPPIVLLARLGGAAVVFFAVTTGMRIGEAYDVAFPVLFAGVALALLLLLGVRRVARRMEERADARAAATVGGAPLASALEKIHAHAQMPMVTGARRVHPDLYDRLTALGVDPGPRPPPPDRRRGLAVGVLVASFIALSGWLALDAAAPAASDLVNQGVALARAGRNAEAVAVYRRAIVLDPTDGIARYDLALALRDLGDRDAALGEARLAAGLHETESTLTLLADLEEGAGRAETARALRQRARRGAAGGHD